MPSLIGHPTHYIYSVEDSGLAVCICYQNKGIASLLFQIVCEEDLKFWVTSKLIIRQFRLFALDFYMYEW